MTFKKIKAAALSLPETSRATLAQSLLESLRDFDDRVDRDVGDQGDHDKVWAEEAARRYEDLKQNPDAAIPAEDVFRRLRAKAS